jgi:hypothetical protein
MRHLVMSNPNAISIWIQSCNKKKLKLSHFSKKCCGPEYGAMICSVMEYAQSDAIKKPGGKDSSQAGREVFFIATLSLVFPGAARQKKGNDNQHHTLLGNLPHKYSNGLRNMR